MGDKSKIAWTEATWNPILGCTKVSEGCKFCYAMKAAYRMSQNPNEKIQRDYAGLTKMTSQGAEWTGIVRAIPGRLEQPKRWREPRLIFVNSMSDIGHGSLLSEDVFRIVDTMAAEPRHTFQVLSKRAGRLRWIIDEVDTADAPHIWWGVSVENQKHTERLTDLLSARRAETHGIPHVRWVSVEPMLGPLDLSPWLRRRDDGRPGLSWVVCGGESGSSSRPFDLQWARDLRDQCKAAKVPFFMKQLSEAVKGFKKFETFPEDLQVREWPALMDIRR